MLHVQVDQFGDKQVHFYSYQPLGVLSNPLPLTPALCGMEGGEMYVIPMTNYELPTYTDGKLLPGESMFYSAYNRMLFQQPGVSIEALTCHFEVPESTFSGKVTIGQAAQALVKFPSMQAYLSDLEDLLLALDKAAKANPNTEHLSVAITKLIPALPAIQATLQLEST